MIFKVVILNVACSLHTLMCECVYQLWTYLCDILVGFLSFLVYLKSGLMIETPSLKYLLKLFFFGIRKKLFKN